MISEKELVFLRNYHLEDGHCGWTPFMHGGQVMLGISPDINALLESVRNRTFRIGI